MCYCLKLCGQTFGSLFLMTVTYFGKKSLNLIPQRLHLESNSKSCFTPIICFFHLIKTLSPNPANYNQYLIDASEQFQPRL